MSQKTKDWSVLSMLEWATDYFESKEIKSPRLSIEWLLAHVLDVKRLDLYLLFDKPLSQSQLDTLRPLIKRRASHEPLQYITGKTSFFNVEIQVNEHVLIPRMETEQLIEIILNDWKDADALKVIDIGTGSGCIPIAIKKEKADWNVKAFDISDEAIGLAKENAILNEVDVEFEKNDLFNYQTDGDAKFDLIISNPPYILKEEARGLDTEVRDFEPDLALFCESTESMYSALEEFGKKYLNNGGKIYLELNDSTAKEVQAIFEKNGWKTGLILDYDSNLRFLTAEAI